MSMTTTVANGFKLSPQQKHLWLLQQTATEGQPFRVQGKIQIEGAISPERLHTAIEEAVRRHEILRTCFTSVAGMRLAVQSVQEEPQIAWREHDLSSLAPDTQVAEILRLTQGLSHELMDFAKGSLLVAWLVKQSSQQHLLLLSLPALCADGITLANLLHEIGRAYSGENPDEEAIQYADIAEVFNDLLESEETETGREYWRKHDISAPSQFPFAKELAQPTLFDPHTLPVSLAAEIVSRLESLAEAQDSSLAAVLLAAWQLLLARLIGEQEIVVGAAYDGRGFEGLESALGLFARYLPIPSTLEMPSPFIDFLAQVNEKVDEVFEWQDYFSLELVRGLSGNERWTPFLPFQFEFAESPEPYSDGDITFSLLEQQSCTERFRVKVSAVAGAQGLSLTLHYNASLYSLARMQRLTAQFATLLDSIAADPEQSIGDLNIVSEAEREELLTQMYRTGIPYPAEHCIPELFTEQAQRTPERIALSIQGEQLTFAELEGRANQLAHYLRSLGVGADKRVGLYGTRSLEIMVGLLAILKAGGAYVAIDPIYPMERLVYILEDTEAVALVTQESLSTTIPASQNNVIFVDRDAETIATFPQTPPEVSLRPENLAYLIYTSG
nr:AMP-binding protein [Ardenticatenales bacterium]